MGLSAMDFFDRLTAQTLMPLGALFTCIMVGWFVERKVVRSELIGSHQQLECIFVVVRFMFRYVCPLAILLVFLHQIGVV